MSAPQGDNGGTPDLSGQTASPAGPFPIALPSQVYAQLRGVKQVSSILTRDASDYVDGYSQRVNPIAPEAIFSPAWESGYSPFDKVSYAIYRFDLTARTGKLGINTQWTQGMADKKLLWIGASNWQKDRWDWRSGDPTGVVDTGTEGMGLYRHPDTGEMYVAVVVLGIGAAKLSKVWLTCSLRGDWWMGGRESGRASCSPFIGPDTPAIQWQTQLGFGGQSFGAVYDADGVIYVPVHVGLQPIVTLYALYPDGSQKWGVNLSVPSAYSSIPAIDDDGTVYYAPGNGGPLHALLPGGTEKWAYSPHDGAVGSAVLGPEGNIYIVGKSGNSKRYLCAINRDGSLRWEHDFNSAEIAEPAVAADGTVYVGGSDNELYAFNPDGGIKWHYSTGAPVNDAVIAGPQGQVYFYISGSDKLGCLTAAGTLAWDLVWPSGLSYPHALSPSGDIYAVSGEHSLCAVNPAGAVDWSYYPANGSCAVDAEGTAYVCGIDTRLYALDASGGLKWWFQAAAPLNSRPAIGEDGTLYAGDDLGNFYAFGPGGQQQEYSASGYVKDSVGVGIAGVEITITGEEPVVTDGLGFWSKAGLAQGLYLVSPTHQGWTFEPRFTEITVGAGDVVAADFTGQADTPPPWPMWGFNRAHTRRSSHAGPDTPELMWSVWNAGEDFRGEPVIDGSGAVYFQGISALYCYEAAGTERWRRDPGVLSSDISPLIGLDGTIYVVPSSSLIKAYSPGGVFKWSFDLWNPASGPPIIAPDGTIVVGCQYAITSFFPDGAINWINQSFQVRNQMAIADDGTFYVNNNGSWSDEFRHIIALNPDGSLKWMSEDNPYVRDGPLSFSIGADGTVYFNGNLQGEQNTVVLAMNPDGSFKWTYGGADDVLSGISAIAADGTLFCVRRSLSNPNGDYLCAVDADGIIKWEYYADGYSFTSLPTVDAGGTIYIGIGTLGAVRAINPDGTLKWSFDDPPADTGGIAIGADGTLYFGDRVGYVYAIGPGAG